MNGNLGVMQFAWQALFPLSHAWSSLFWRVILIYKTMITGVGGGRGGRPSGGSAGSRISLSYLELMYKMKGGHHSLTYAENIPHRLAGPDSPDTKKGENFYEFFVLPCERKHRNS